MMTIQQQLNRARNCLAEVVASARLEAEILLQHVLNKPRSFLYSHADISVTPEQQCAYAKLVERRQAGEPIAYLLGNKDFWDMTLAVTPDVLIPRPETELLVEAVLQLVRANQPIKLLELGTGSGALAIALARERPHWEITATDRSTRALALARANADDWGANQIRFIAGDWYAALPVRSRFDVILSNPPYVSATDPHLAQGDCRFEPQLALTDGADGLTAITAIITKAPNYLLPGGWLLLEHGFDQASKVRQLMQKHHFKSITTQQDLAGHDRLTFGCG